MTIYAELQNHLSMIAQNEEEYHRFVNLTAAHMAGEAEAWELMPDVLRVAFLEWEEDNS